jgi:uncharacterized protein YsxB (DUF464 family)
MPSTPQFSYFISPGETPVSENSDLWLQPLPLSRHLLGENSAISLGHGEYFQTIRNFLENDDNEIICRALTRRLQQDVKAQDIREIQLCLVKHGEFYHPARIEVLTHRHKIPFVLNVAVSESGLKTIKREYSCLIKLNDDFPICFLPEVFGFGEVASTGDRKIRMFLGHWFEGYKEFHISRDPSDNRNQILVWDDIRGPYYLSLKQSAELYRQAARILTYYYNVESFEQIFPWHHGAGDFVVKNNKADLDLKLISARGYAPLFTNPNHLKDGEKDTELILQALLIFFLNLSIRMRVDRYDGVGDVVWADGPVVQSTLDGFFDGLALNPSVESMPDSLDNCFRYYLSVCTKEDLYDLSQAVLETFNRRAPEVRVVKQHLKGHAEELSRVIGQVNCR